MDNFRYITVENSASGMTAVKLLDEPFSNMIVSFGNIEAVEDAESNSLQLKFEYEILDDANKNLDNEPFEAYLGELLQDIIHRGIANAQAELGDK